MTKKGKKEFEIIYGYLDTPEAEQRLKKALDLLISEEDLYEKQ